jgi:hypothetical protein
MSGVGFQTHYPSVLASEDSSCLKLRGHCDRNSVIISIFIYLFSRYSDWQGFNGRGAGVLVPEG